MLKLLFRLLFIYCLLSAGLAHSQPLKADRNKYQLLVRDDFSGDSSILLVKLRDGQSIKGIPGLAVLRRLDPTHYVVKASTALSEYSFDTQRPANSLWKASDNLLSELDRSRKRPLKITLALEGNTIPNSLFLGNASEVLIAGKTVSLTIRADKLNTLLNNPSIVFADLQRTAKDETLINNLDLSVNQVSQVHSAYPHLMGNGIRVSLKEQLFNFNDLDLLGRSIVSPNQSSNASAHATVMATLVGGNGNSFAKGLGAAPGVGLTSSNYANLSPDQPPQLNSLGVSIQNHSYGTGIENYYGIEAAGYDQQIRQVDTIMHIFSSGNSGTATPLTGIYTDISNYANLTGTFKQAKNVLVVGGTNNENTLETLSSAGPAYDGRIKPEMVTAGEEGTSGAAALTSGVVALLQQEYKARNGYQPSAALLKSVLLNSAVDIGIPNVDYKAGFGRLNAFKAVRTISESRFHSGSVADEEEQDWPLTVLQDGEIKVTIVWNDLPAALNSPSALINDLDLWLEDPSGNRVLPWVLSSYPHPDSLSKPAIRKRDSLNNVEQVTLNGPAGLYKIHVRGNKVSAGSQPYYVSFQTNRGQEFQWTYPLLDSRLFAGEDNYLRWESSLPESDGIVSVSFDSGITWNEIGSADLGKGLIKWNIPEVFNGAILKMTVGSTDFLSERFSVSKPMKLNVGYNCNDGVLLMWPKHPLASAYHLYTIRENRLQVLKIITDTSVLIRKPQEATSDFYAVSAIHPSGFEGIRSLTINAADQGVQCYFQSLLADVSADKTISLTIRLGTILGLKSIRWEKQTSPDLFSSLGNTSLIPGTYAYTFSDSYPKQGIQYYRAVLETMDGRQITSDLASVIFLEPYNFTLFPNPATQTFTILSGTIDNFELSIFDAQGQKLRTEVLNNINQTFDIETLTKGIYVYVISLKGKPIFQGKLIKI